MKKIIIQVAYYLFIGVMFVVALWAAIKNMNSLKEDYAGCLSNKKLLMQENSDLKQQLIDNQDILSTIPCSGLR